jgi:flagellar motility protein MotE (MotC chaperone)
MIAAKPSAFTAPRSWKDRLSGIWLPRRPLSMLFVAASVAAVANTWVFAAPQKEAAVQDTRLGVSLREDMARRDRLLAEEKRKLDIREQAAKAGEVRLAEELAARQGLADAGAAAAAGRPKAGAEANEPFDDLARVYQMMKPARAAPIFEKLEREVQTEVIRRMRDRSAALLMAAMNPNAAAELTMSLAGRTVVPQRAKTPAETPPRRRQPAAQAPAAGPQRGGQAAAPANGPTKP